MKRFGARYRAAANQAFTILEVMIAMFIFSLVLTAIYTIWVGIAKGKIAVETSLAEVQRSRIAMHALEDAFLTVQMYAHNAPFYAFNADTSQGDAYVSMVSRLPASYPGVGRYASGELVVRRVTFFTDVGSKGDKELVMTQAPMLAATNQAGSEGYSIVLARDVNEFTLKFWDVQKSDWVEEWLYTNQVPPLVHITLGLGKTKGSSGESHDLVQRIVAIPAMAAITGVPGRPNIPGMPNMPGQPGVPGTYPPGTVNPNPYGTPGMQPGLPSRTLPRQGGFGR